MLAGTPRFDAATTRTNEGGPSDLHIPHWHHLAGFSSAWRREKGGATGAQNPEAPKTPSHTASLDGFWSYIQAVRLVGHGRSRSTTQLGRSTVRAGCSW